MQQPTAYTPPEYISECNVDPLPDGRIRVIHRETGSTLFASSWRQAHLKATALSIAHSWE